MSTNKIILYEKNVSRIERLNQSNNGTIDIDANIKQKSRTLIVKAKNIKNGYEICMDNFNTIYHNIT